MNLALAKVSANGQITIPVEIRRTLGLESGDKIIFFANQDGDIVVNNASAQALIRAQKAFEGETRKAGVTSEEDVMALVDELRYAK